MTTARGRMAAALVLAAVLTAGPPAASHTGGSTGYATIAIDGTSIRYTLTLWPATLPAEIREQLEHARAGDAGARDRLLSGVADKTVLVADGQRCQARARSVAAATAENITLTVDFVCAEGVRDLLVHDDLFDVFGKDYHTLARVDGPGRTWQFAFAPDAREARVRVADGPSGAGSFIRLGIEHILTGYDHLLFLLGLLLPGGGVVALAKIITAFTVAHSVTLSLAVLDVVTLPDRLIEAVIGLSIAAVAAENLFSQAKVTRRWIVSFAFGLVHGFGFSSALRELGLPAQGLLVSLLGFNVGVEIGQALVVAVTLPILIALRKTAYERRLLWGSSLAILVVGLVLFVERAFL